MSSVIEYDMWKRGDYAAVVEKKEEIEKKTEQSKRSHELFKELFDD
jgi:hypothetical protein